MEDDLVDKEETPGGAEGEPSVDQDVSITYNSVEALNANIIAFNKTDKQIALFLYILSKIMF